METRRVGLGVVALASGIVVLALGIIAAALSAADSGTSFGPQFLVAERAWFIAVAAAIPTFAVAVVAIATDRGRRLAVAAIVVVVASGPISIVVMDSLPAAG